ncbi:MAG: dihydroneopterin aldolase [Chitinophagales bacterium]
MNRIVLEGMLFKSHIGVYDYEQLYGNNFEVDLHVESAAIRSSGDAITSTLDYVELYRIVHQVMGGRYNLIETACADIIQQVRQLSYPIESVYIRIAKLHPPLGEEVRKVWIEMAG